VQTHTEQSSTKTQNSSNTIPSSTLRIDAQRLDHLIDLVGELVIAGANNTLIAKQLGHSGAMDSTATVARLIEEIRDSSLHLRMVQIGQTFNRFRRTVRDISAQVGKEIHLSLNGEDTELDRSVVEKLSDPLMHMIRNAIDHGIESKQQRLALNKPSQGQISLNARHESGCIVIEVQDDGKGLDKQRIVNKAIAQGLTYEGSDLKDSDIFQFIFEPAFSTAETISAISGRGVGMDVVRQNIEALRGTIEVESSANVGTTIRVRLPLTLAIIDGFLVKVANNTYVIPVENIIECIEFDKQLNSNAGFTNLRGELLPYLRLRGLFGEKEVPLSHQDLVVINYGKEKAGLVVDGLLGEFQTVLKPLGKIFNPVSWITGSTILGTGEVAVILDVVGLIQLSKKQQT
jgi:two-component system chemotaxis sensor kinase CheA